MVVAPQNIETINNNTSNNIITTNNNNNIAIDSASVGLDYIVENSDYVEKLVAALESDNIAVKKQVFELLSALCVYNVEGYKRTFDCLDFYKTKTGERYRYKFIIKELENGTSSNEYQTAILAFINCLILSTQDIRERIRIRSEFIGLKLLHVLHDLRNKQDADLIVQLDVFDEQKESDESQIDPNSHEIDLSSPLEVFDAILRQIADTPQEIPFLCILQHLLRIESKEAISDIIWDAAERLVHRATLLESTEDALRLFKTQSHAKSLSKLKGSTNGEKCNCQCHQKFDRRASVSATNISADKNFSTVTDSSCSANNGNNNSSQLANTSFSLPPTPLPPLPPPVPQACPPPPPPPTLNSSNIPNGIPSPPKPLPKLPQQTIPTPSTKMRTINWNKISSSQVLQGNKNNLWATFAKTHSNTPIQLDWGKLEGLFCLPNEKSGSNNNTLPTSSIVKNKNPSVTTVTDKLNSKRELHEIILLDAKRSLNINIFLKQFRRPNEEMITLIKNGCSEDFGSEKLRGLLKIFPLKDEIDMLNSVSDADKTRLASAEKFLFQLIQVSNCQLRIEAMLLKEELESCVNNVESSINSIFQAAEDVKSSTELQEVIFMILAAGNFLNSGGYAGDAAGLKLSSLQKIVDIRGNKPGVSLLHFIATEAEVKNPRLITFVNDLMTLEEASKTNTDNLKNEIFALKSKVTHINEQLKQPNIAQDVVQQFCRFFQDAIVQVESLETSFNEIEKVRVDLAYFFCEEVSSFKLEDCFKILFTFTNTWKMVANENNRRKILEKEGEARKLLRDSQLKQRQQMTPQQHWQKSKDDAFSSKNLYMDDVILSSPRIPKKRLDNNGNANSLHGSNDQLLTPSPDVTPNGSLSRRRARQPFDENETRLMDFLRASGNDASRERHGPVEQTGFPDRSLQRSTRRRPNLSDFVNYDRERPTSPGAIIENHIGVIPSPTGADSQEIPENNRKLRERNTPLLVDLESGSNDNSKRRTNNPKLQRKYSNEFGDELGPGRLSTLPEADASEEENIPTKKLYRDRRPSVKLNTDIVSAMDAIEEAQGPLKTGRLWRRPSLSFANEESEEEYPENSTKGEDIQRRSLIGSLGSSSKPEKEKLVLYIPQASVSPTTNKSLFRHGSTGEEELIPKTSDGSPTNGKGNVFGTEEGFNRFASIRRSRKIKQMPETPAVKNPKQKFVTKVDIVGENSKNVEAKLVNETTANKLKALFGQSKQKSESKSLVRPLSRANSVDVGNKPPSRTVYTSRNKINSSAPHAHDKDEGFEESQSSLSETNSHIDTSHLLSRTTPNRPPTRRGGFREGREAVSTRSIVAAQQRAAASSQLKKQESASNLLPSVSKISSNPMIENNKNVKNTIKTNSRSSLLSSRSSITSQNSIKDSKVTPDSKSNKIIPSNPKLTRSISTTHPPSGALINKPNGLRNSFSKTEVKTNVNTSKEKESSVKQPATKRVLSFMRPTASSTAKDKIESTTSAKSATAGGLQKKKENPSLKKAFR